MDWKHLFLSADGRINRAKYWAASLSMTGIAIVVIGILALPLMSMQQNAPMTPIQVASLVLISVFYIFALYVSIMIGIKRFHDRDKSGWWMLIVLAPYIGGIWIFVECGCLRGTTGRNRFGADPLALNDDIVQVFGGPERTPIR